MDRHAPPAPPLADAQAVRRMALAAAQPGGGGLLAALARDLAASLDAPAGVIAVYADEARHTLRTVAASVDGTVLPGFELPARILPGAGGRGHGPASLASGLQAHLPEDAPLRRAGLDACAGLALADSAGVPLGWVGVLDRTPLPAQRRGCIDEVLRIAGARAAAEIERRRTDETARAVALAVSASRTGSVFDELVRLLATILHVEIAFIARTEEEHPDSLYMLAMAADGQILQDFRYPLAGSPCETVLGQRFRAYCEDVQARFPDDQDVRTLCARSYAGHPLTGLDGTPLGIVSVVSRRPLTQVGRVRATLKIFAVRAAAEVERLQAAQAQKRALEDLRQREAQYRTIFESSLDGLYMWDEHLRIVDVNPAGCALYGHSREELLGQTYPPTMPQAYVRERLQMVQRALAGQSTHVETTVLRPDGSTFEADLHVMPFVQRGRPHALAVVRDITERRQRERELRRSEARLRATVEAAFDCVIGMDGNGRIVEFNAAAERMLGYQRADVLGRELVRMLLPSRLQAGYRREMRRFRRRAGEAVAGRLLESVMVRADGSEVPVEMAVSVAAVPEGSIFVGHVRDITERRRAEQALRDSEEQYRAIFNASLDALVLRDADFGVVDVNATYEAMTGFSRAEVLGADRVLANPQEVSARIRALHEKALAGATVRLETQLLRRDGHRYELELRGVPAQHRGQPHVLYIGRDITQAKQAERALRDSEEQYRAIFNASADALVLRDASYRAVEVNPAYTTLTGYTREEVMTADNVLTQPHAGLRALHRAEHDRALAGQPLRFDVTAVRKDGTLRQIEVRGTPVTYRGQPHVLYASRDITERVQAEQRRSELERQLRQAQKMEAIGQLTGGLAHDFNNILTSVLGYLTMAQERPAASADPALARQLAQARLAADRARDHVAQLLAFSRPRRGERRPMALAQVAGELVQLLRPTLPSTIAVECSADDSGVAVPPVLADPVQFEQVLLNLCLNARDAIGEHGTISLHIGHGPATGHCASCSARLEGVRWVAFEVADDGHGMTPEVTERMFEPFFTTKGVGRGTGMGLAMVHGIVHDHGGHLQVATAPGRGASFRVLLPAAAVDAPPREATAVPPRAEAGALHGRVLLVEDEPIVSGFMADLLDHWGLDVVLEHDPFAASNRLAGDEAFALLLTDQTMPGMTGLALARQARELRPGLPVLLYTGNSLDLAAPQLDACGVAALLRKPIDTQALRTLLGELLGRRELAPS